MIVPFRGPASAAETLLHSLGGLRLTAGDEVLVADNTADGLPLRGRGAIRVVRAEGEASSYHARNVAASHAATPWLLFTDADCRPPASLLDDFFAQPIDSEVGALGGVISPAPAGRRVARWSASREILSQRQSLLGAGPPAAATANLLVRRAAFDSVGGFLEGVRSGEDFEFCWRLQDAGWRIDYRPEVAVEHRHRETLRGIASQMARYGAGNAWQERRRPGSSPRPSLAAALARAAIAAPTFLLARQPERALMKGIDALAAVAHSVGRARGNAAPRASAAGPTARPPLPGRSVVIASDFFPTLSEGFVLGDVESLRRAGRPARVEAVARPARPRFGGTWDVAASYLEDEGPLDRLAALAWLASRHPLRCLADLRLRRSFAPEERMPLRAIAPAARRLIQSGESHVHVHFAALAAANWLRAGRVARVPVSIAAHAHEIFVTPRELAAKLERAAFTVAASEYTADHLRELVAPAHRARIRKLAVGIDTQAFQRGRPYPGGRTVVAVGRLVEKKGFRHLLEATALLGHGNADKRGGERVVIVGDGPLRAELASLRAELGLEDRVELAGSLEPAAVRELLEQADVLCLPCVIAADGDRDALPVVAYEALAMEVPVIASDLVGLPEVVGPAWGRLVPPGDSAALAQAIADVLALSPDERQAMGRAGRAHVVEHADLDRTRRALVELFDGGSTLLGSRCDPS